mmetsp:Transcript_47998/g.138987  ORF Transcript_47998/g.138987 Transcript_47998/m.138987 type:complete len:228 (-) Transcript_47998:522-1205(-)
MSAEIIVPRVQAFRRPMLPPLGLLVLATQLVQVCLAVAAPLDQSPMFRGAGHQSDRMGVFTSMDRQRQLTRLPHRLWKGSAYMISTDLCVWPQQHVVDLMRQKQIGCGAGMLRLPPRRVPCLALDPPRLSGWLRTSSVASSSSFRCKPFCASGASRSSGGTPQILQLMRRPRLQRSLGRAAKVRRSGPKRGGSQRHDTYRRSWEVTARVRSSPCKHPIPVIQSLARW